MDKADNLIKIFAGTEVAVLLLKGELEQIGVTALSKNDSSSSFLGVVPGAIDLYIQESDMEKAEAVINDFVSKNRI